MNYLQSNPEQEETGLEAEAVLVDKSSVVCSVISGPLFQLHILGIAAVWIGPQPQHLLCAVLHLLQQHEEETFLQTLLAEGMLCPSAAPSTAVCKQGRAQTIASTKAVLLCLMCLT